ncbi:hypothetical protein SBA2_60033 [Acidobacteriia bacterium SbA2]|nr:hypothetical protein SBA2_60033 [Acidobacteriia bacterium SbA2]
MSDDVERFDRWSKTYESCWGQRFFDRVHELMLDLVIAAAPAFTPAAIRPRIRRSQARAGLAMLDSI